MTQESGSRGPGARARLVALLREMAELAGERSLKRCPYRAVGDVCTFRGECGNRYRRPGAKALCTGGPLNARKADEAEVARAFEGTGTQAQAQAGTGGRTQAGTGTGELPHAQAGMGTGGRPQAQAQAGTGTGEWPQAQAGTGTA